MHKSKLKRITVALCIALVPVSVFAAGLGKLSVMSGLGEPLKADIELISVTPEELNSISASIASQEAYAIQGIEKPASHNTIKVDLAKNATGAPILKLKSVQPISEPFLDMLIQVDWASGRLLREYTVLLDPPGYTGEVDTNAVDSQTAQAPIVSAGKSKQNGSMSSGAMQDETMTSVPTSPKKTSKRSKKIKAEAASIEEVAPIQDVNGQEYVTHSGDTLMKIARDMKPEGISLEQMLVGLYQANPQAFQGDNMNRLKVGQIMRQPSAENLSAITSREAVSEIKVQTANWNAYRNKLAGIVADTAPSDTEASTQSAGGKIKSAAEDNAATGPKDVVKLSAGEVAAAKASAENVKSLQDKITVLQEEATAREKSVKEAQDRTVSLEKQIADMQKLLAMKNAAMADLQKQAEMQAADKNKTAEAKPAETTPLAASEAPKSEAKPTEAPSAVSETPKPAVADNTEKPKTKPVAITAPEPIPEQSFIASLMDGMDMSLLAPAGGLLALLGGGWMYLRKKREKSLADFEQGIMTSGGLKANTVFGNTASASVDTGDTSFLTDFSQSANGGMIDTNDVDPIAEAEVYMAYGRDAQAEEILKDAISKEPKRYELHLKLLEMYAASKNTSAFETIAGELYTTLGAEDPTWAKVSEIGIKLEPSNPLYQAGNNPTGGVAVGGLDANDFSNSPLAAEKDLDFTFDNDALTKGFAPKGIAKTEEIDLDLGKAEEPKTLEASFEATAEEVVSESDLVFEMDAKPETVLKVEDNTGAMEFDMGSLGDFESTAPVESIKTAAEKFGHTMPSLDIPTFSAPNFMPETTEVANEFTPPDTLDVDTFQFDIEETAQSEGVLDISGMEAEIVKFDMFDEVVNTQTDGLDTASFSDASFAEANTFDLTTIDLALNEAADLATVEANIEVAAVELNVAGNELIEVDTKLDLVAAYIEMDDKEGAKELLAEVMKEGGPGQRKRAEALLEKLA